MKIIAFNGSPKAERSSTNVMVASLLEGAREAGAEIENIFLAQKKIAPCLGCFSCWTKTRGKCVIQDDMAELLRLLPTADIIVYASPLYVDNVTGIMKNFMDRQLPTSDPLLGKDEHGEYRYQSTDKKLAKLVVVSNCGLPEQSHFQTLHLLFKRLARNMNAEVIAEIYRGAGPLLMEKNILIKPVLTKYKNLLKQAGKELVNNMKLSEDLIVKLEKPLIPHNYYIKVVGKYWDKFK